MIELLKSLQKIFDIIVRHSNFFITPLNIFYRMHDGFRT